MSIQTVKVNELPLATDVTQFEIPGFDITTNAGAKALMSNLKGEKGDAPNITVTMTTLPYGSTPTVNKTGTNENPNFQIGFPLAENGQTPEFQKTADYIQYRYGTGNWNNLVAIADITGPTGQEGAAGTNGTNGADGLNPELQAGTTTTLPPGQDATAQVTQTGTSPSGNPIYSFSFGIPQGVGGLQPQFIGGTITASAPGTQPNLSWTKTGTTPEGADIYTISGSIPKGQDGAGNMFWDGFEPIENQTSGYVLIPDKTYNPGDPGPINFNMQKIDDILHRVAFTGDYNDLINKP